MFGTSLKEELEHRGISRREFMGFCATMAAVLALPDQRRAQLPQAVENGAQADPESGSSSRTAPATPSRSCGPAVRRPPRSSSTCCRSTITRRSWRRPATRPKRALAQTVREQRRQLHRRRRGLDSDRRQRRLLHDRRARRRSTSRARSAAAPRPRSRSAPARPSAAFPAAAPNPTGALGVADAVPGVKNLINLSACPANVENLTALLVYYLTFKRWPPLDHYRRPLFAYGKSIHDNCERRAHFDAGQYVEAWGDEGHRAGYCLYKMGCKGPVTFQNCPERPLERRHQLADRLRPSLHRLRRAGFLGPHDAVLPAPPGRSGLRRRVQHRHDRRRLPSSASARRSPATG